VLFISEGNEKKEKGGDGKGGDGRGRRGGVAPLT